MRIAFRSFFIGSDSPKIGGLRVSRNDAQARNTKRNASTGVQLRISDAHAVDPCSIGRTEIPQERMSVDNFKLAVVARDARVM